MDRELEKERERILSLSNEEYKEKTLDGVGEKKELRKYYQKDITLISSILPFWEEGKRNVLCMNLAGFLRKQKYSLKHAKTIITEICRITKDEEMKQRLYTVEHTYKKDLDQVRGWEGLKEIIPFESLKEIGNINKYYSNKLPVDVYQDNKFNSAKKFHQINPYFYDTTGMFWLWNNDKHKYEMIDETGMMNLLRKNCNDANIIKSKEWGEIIRAMKVIGRDKEPKEIPNSWIQFKKEIYDIKTRESFDSTPEYFNTNSIPWELGTKKETPTIDKIFAEWVGEDKIILLKEIAAYCMLSNYPVHRIFCFIGRGLNGKGEYLRFIRKLIGEENCTSTELDIIMNSRFESCKLYKKLVCQMGETNFSEMSKTSMLKKLSGQDLVGVEFKNKQPFDYQNYAKLMISTNSLPPSNDKTDGFYRRWCIIDFPKQFSEGKDIVGMIPDIEFNNFCLQCIDILINVLEKGKFTNEGSIQDRMKVYEAKSNPLQEFIKTFFQNDPNGKVPYSEFFEGFASYCKRTGFRIFTKKALAKELDEIGLERVRENFYDEDRYTTKWFIHGINQIIPIIPVIR